MGYVSGMTSQTSPLPVILAIADEGDLIGTVRAADLIDALMIATDQLDVKSDEDANGYGIDTAADAHAMRDRLLAVLATVNGAM